MVSLQMTMLLGNARENAARGIGRCFSSPALLPLVLLLLVLQYRDGVGEQERHEVQHGLSHLDGED